MKLAPGKKTRADTASGGVIGAQIDDTVQAQIDRAAAVNPLVDYRLRLSQKESLHIVIQLKSMLEAGVPMLSSLRTLIEHAQTQRQEKVLEKITTIVEGGVDLSAAMACLPRCFESYVVHLLAAGEKAGAVGESLTRAEELMRKQMTMRGKILGALAYPGFLLLFTAAITTGILILLVPKFESILMSKPELLPTTTKIVLAASEFLRNSPWVAFVAFGIVIGGVILMAKNRRVQGMMFDIISRMPVIGTFIHKAYIARSVTTLALTLESGVPILTGLDHARQVSALPKLQRMWEHAGDVVRDGHPLHSALKGADLPPALMQMMIAGESSGSLDESLRTAAGFLDRETDAALKTFTGLLGPMTVMIAGVCVGFVVVALMTPILQMAKFVG